MGIWWVFIWSPPTFVTHFSLAKFYLGPHWKLLHYFKKRIQKDSNSDEGK